MDSKFCGLIAYIIYCLRTKFDGMNEVILLDNSTNDILLFNGIYEADNKNYRIMDYTRNSVVMGNDSQFIDIKSKKLVIFKRIGMTFRGVVTPQMESFIGSVQEDRVMVISSKETYTFDCKRLNKGKRAK